MKEAKERRKLKKKLVQYDKKKVLVKKMKKRKISKECI